ncbi:hypothetical protein ACQ86F_33540 [Streptomyces venezuelae ATCC 10712]
MTTATTTELDVLGALLAFDFIGFAQKSAALDPADARYGQAVGCAFGLAARRRFPGARTPRRCARTWRGSSARWRPGPRTSTRRCSKP